MYKFGLLTAVVFLLSGCSDLAIDVVKNASPKSGDFTYEQSLNNSDVCKNISWKRDEDNNGRPVVLYSCQLAIKDDATEIFKKKAQDDLNNSKTAHLNSRIEKIEELKKDQKRSTEEIERI